MVEHFCGRLDPFDLGRFFNHVVGQHQQAAHFLEGAFVAAANGLLILENRLYHPRLEQPNAAKHGEAHELGRQIIQIFIEM